MAYDEGLAERLRAILGTTPGYGERKMFGGLCVLLHGNMCCGVVGEALMVRVGPAGYEAALAKPHARPMDFTGRPMRGMLYVDPAGLKTKRQLATWVERAALYAATLPRK